jgi:hypothetical protein
MQQPGEKWFSPSLVFSKHWQCTVRPDLGGIILDEYTV